MMETVISRSTYTSNGEVIRFSTASTTPSFVINPIAVEPSCKGNPITFPIRYQNNLIPVYSKTNRKHRIQFVLKVGNLMSQ